MCSSLKCKSEKVWLRPTENFTLKIAYTNVNFVNIIIFFNDKNENKNKMKLVGQKAHKI